MDRIERDVLVDAPVERVWNASTWAEHGTGRAIMERGGSEVLFSWRLPGPLGPDPLPGRATLVEFTLSPENGGSLPQVVEIGSTRLDPSPGEQEKHAFDGAGSSLVGGWLAESAELLEYLEK